MNKMKMITAETKQGGPSASSGTIFNGFLDFFFGKCSEETCQACYLVFLAWIGGLTFNQRLSRLDTRLMKMAVDVDSAVAFNAFDFLVELDKSMKFSDKELREVLLKMVIPLLESMGNTLRLELSNLGTVGEIITYWKASQHSVLLVDHLATTYIINGLISDCFSTFMDERRKSARILLNVCLLLQCLDKHTPFATICKTWEVADSMEEFLSWFPILRKGLVKEINSITQDVNMLTNLRFMGTMVAQALDNETMLTDKNLETLSGPKISIRFKTSGAANEATVKYTVYCSMLLKWLCRAYCNDKNVSLKSIRFSIKGNPVFLSSAGKKTLQELGLKGGSIIQVSVLPDLDLPTKRDTPIKSKKRNFSKSPKKNKKRKTNTKKKKTASPNNLYEVVSEEEMHKREHSKAISKVLEEAERTKFKAIRQR